MSVCPTVGNEIETFSNCPLLSNKAWNKLFTTKRFFAWLTVLSHHNDTDLTEGGIISVRYLYRIVPTYEICSWLLI